MGETVMTLFGIVRIILGSLVLALFLGIVWKTLRLGPDLVMARAMLQSARSLRITVVLTLAILVQLASNGIELYEDVSGTLLGGQAWANEGLEALTLLLFLAALLLFVPVVRVPSTAVHASRQG